MLTLYIKTVEGKDADYVYVVYDAMEDKYTVIVVRDGIEYLRFNKYESLGHAKSMVDDLVAHREDW